MNEPDENAGFLSELLRRRVIRSAVAYVVVAWGVVEVGSVVLPEFGAPAWAMRAVILVLVVGFPPAILLAWTVDLSRQGIVRTPDSGYLRAHGQWPRLVTLLVATAMSAAVLWLVWDDYILQTVQRPLRTAIKSQPVIAVNSPRQRIGRPENSWLGDGVANLIRSDLAESRHAIVISQSRWNALTKEVTNTDGLASLARQLGVDYLIDGEYLETPDAIVLTTYIEDLETGTQIHSSRTSDPNAAGVIASVPEHSTRIKQALRIPHTVTVGSFGADFAIENVAAYETYIAGLAYWDDFNYQAAETAFSAALETASDYHIARLRLAQVYEATGRSTLAWTTLDSIPANAELSERLRLYIAGAKAYFVAERDPKKAIDVYRRLVELYPYEFEARLFLSDSYYLDFQDLAAITEARRLAQYHAYDPNSWMELGTKLLEYGDLDEARIALEKFVLMQPKEANAHAMLGNLTQLQGNLDTSVEHHRHALALDPGFVESKIGLAGTYYLQGDVAEARALWQTVVDDPDANVTYRIDAALDLAGMLCGLGMYEDSLLLLSDTMPVFNEEGRRAAMALSQQASIQYENGNRERAETLFEESIRIAPPPVTRYLFARGMLEIRLGRFDAVGNIIDDILTNATEPGSTNADALGAANYLNGLSALQQDDLTAASTYLSAAVDGIGYRYAVYELGLARLYRATGELGRARELAEFAADYHDSGELRLDLELDRVRALLLLAEVLVEQGAHDDGRARAREFIDRWRNANADLPEIVRAKQLIEPRVPVLSN